MHKRIHLRIEEDGIEIRDPNAAAMWDKCRAQTYKDKTKYNRKNNKHSSSRFDDDW